MKPKTTTIKLKQNDRMKYLWWKVICVIINKMENNNQFISIKHISHYVIQTYKYISNVEIMVECDKQIQKKLLEDCSMMLITHTNLFCFIYLPNF